MSEAVIDFSEDEISTMLANLDQYTPEEVQEIDKLVDELGKRKNIKTVYDDLIAFCKHMQPDYIVGKHHRMLANMLMDIEQGKKDRICVNIPPRHGKSQLVSIFFPAWFLGRNPNKKVMMVSHTTDLAVDFGRKVRNLISTDEYQSIFPTVQLASDSKSAGRWNTNSGGEYYACGIGSSIAGRGADLQRGAGWQRDGGDRHRGAGRAWLFRMGRAFCGIAHGCGADGGVPCSFRAGLCSACDQP